MKLDSHLSAGEDVAGQFDFGEVALADGLEEPVVADVRLIVRAGSHGVPAACAEGAARHARALVRPTRRQRRMLHTESIRIRVRVRTEAAQSESASKNEGQC